MSLYGLLINETNTGADSEILVPFSAPLSIISNQPAFASDTLNLKRKIKSQNVQRWEIETNLVPTNNSTALMIHNVINGVANIFNIRMPQIFGKYKLPAGLPLSTVGFTSKLSSSVMLTGHGANILPIGDFITFDGHNKVYLITKDLGANIVEISPPLLTDIFADTSVSYGDSVTMKARYDSSTILGIKFVDGVLADNGSTVFLEAL
jgi:hypothetical protein